jgi:hypothetical protein
VIQFRYEAILHFQNNRLPNVRQSNSFIEKGNHRHVEW